MVTSMRLLDRARDTEASRGRSGEFQDESAKVPIAIFNVKYSPNLGDGVIAECLESELRRCNPMLEPRSIDLAGRSGFASSNGKGRGRLLSVLELLPDAIRGLLVPRMLRALVHFSLKERWSAAMVDCRAAIIGGGALFADHDQNFPIKLAGVLNLCGARKLPVAIAHVGVTRGWSSAARKRVGEALQKTAIISNSVRDEPSVGNWVSELGKFEVPTPHVAPDPGLLSCFTYGKAPKPPVQGASPKVGICATSPLVLRLHGDKQAASRVESWLRAGIDELLARGNEIFLFSNGSPEDEKFREAVASQFRGRSGFHLAPCFTTPGELARYIAHLDCVIAHRLHACIIAYSYRIPAIGLTWDRKLDSFFASVDRSHFVIDPAVTEPGVLAEHVLEAIAAPPEPERHAQIISACRSGISALAERLKQVEEAA